MTKAHILRDMRNINGVYDEKPYSCRIAAMSLGVDVANAQSHSRSALAQNSGYQIDPGLVGGGGSVSDRAIEVGRVKRHYR
jgi:hypothetical protein